MSRNSIIILIIAIILVSVGLGVFLNIKENERIEREAVTYKENLTVEFGKEAKVSDFIQNLNGTLLDDFEINTEVLGDIDVTFEFLNIKDKHRTRTFTIKILDVEAPRIIMGDTFKVTEGYEKNLTDVLLSGDEIDDNPKREILGNYDFNTVGKYNLTYVVTDSSGNKTSKDFVLQVNEKKEEEDKDKEKDLIYLEDVIDNHKKDDTKIGVDVSKWQEDIDWEEVKNAGIEFAMIRVGTQKRI